MSGQEEQNPVATDAQLEFVEEFALTMELMGLVRMTGRVTGWLLVCDPPEQTFGQIAEVLQASKGSISTALKFLTTARWVIKSSKPGDRRDYYTMRAGALTDLVKQQSMQYEAFAESLGRGIALFEGLPEEKTERLRDMYEFFAFMGKEMPALMERWDREHGK